MQKFTLALLFSLIAAFGYSQCAEITSYTINSPSPGNYSITVNYTGTPGQTHINAVTFCSSNGVSDLFSVDCIPVNASGTSVFNVSCAATPVVVLVPSSGPCNTGFPCGAPTFVFGPIGGPLPIKMDNFYASRNGSEVSMSWETQTEINSKEFAIEKNSNGTFETVAVVPATNITTGSKYSYTDVNNEKSVSQYRLKMFDMDGSYRYSEIRTVKGIGSKTNFSIFPNPSNGNTKISVADVNAATEIQIVNSSGKLIKTVSLNNQSSVDINNLPNGLYLIRVVNKESGEIVTKKLSVIN